ncbi:MAG: type II 3-dehydroquinate dehydratase [Marinicellaceae bacterium]
MLNITVLNGPNLNLLGIREPEIYGSTGLKEIESEMRQLLEQKQVDSQVTLDFYQSNKEYEIIETIQNLINKNNQCIIFNPAAFTHTSIAIRDALLATKIPFIEVHLSNVYAREEFRKKSWFSDIAIGTITGLGAMGYQLALQYFIDNQIN